ncbi:MAG TPA: MFS transporter [Synergistaceae bacterium]|nr:MFS transporter [Synergistaceae bacterium]
MSYRRLVWTLLFLQFTIMGVSNIYYLLATYLHHLHVTSPIILGWAMGTYYAASTLVRPFVGWLVERYSFRLTMLWGSGGCFLGTLGLALSGSFTGGIIFWRAFMGIASSLFIVSITTFQALEISDEKRGSAFTFVSAGSIAPLLLMVPLAEWMLLQGYIQLYIWFPPAVALACVLLVLTVEPPRDYHSTKHSWGTYRGLFVLPEARTVFLATSLFAFTDAAMVSLAALAMAKSLSATLFISANALTSIVARLFFPSFLDRIPRIPASPVAIALTSGALIIATYTDHPLTFCLGGILFGLGMGFGFPLHLALTADLTPPKLRAKATSMGWFFMSCSFSLCPILLGYLAKAFGIVLAYRSLFSIIFLSTLPLWFYLWRPVYKKTQQPSQEECCAASTD